MPGDQVVGVLGNRNATQELCGDWQKIQHPAPDGGPTLMDDIDGAGLFGKITRYGFQMDAVENSLRNDCSRPCFFFLLHFQAFHPASSDKDNLNTWDTSFVLAERCV
jgi:hypothetical protein